MSWTLEIVGGPIDGRRFTMTSPPCGMVNVPVFGLPNSALYYAQDLVVRCSYIRSVSYPDGREIVQYQWPGIRACERPGLGAEG